MNKQATIKAKEQIAADRKKKKQLEQVERDRVNQERIDKINAAIDKIERIAIKAVRESMDSKQISERLEFCKTYDIQTGFDEFTAKANQVKIATVATLEVLLENKLKSEETERLQKIEADRLKKQQEELQDRIDAQRIEEGKREEERQARYDAETERRRAKLQEELEDAQRKIDAQNRLAAEEIEVSRRLTEERDLEFTRRENELQAEKDRMQKIKDDETERKRLEKVAEEQEKLEAARKEYEEKQRAKDAKNLELKQLEIKKKDDSLLETYTCESINDLESNLDSVGFEFNDLVDVVRAGKIRHFQWTG